MRRRLLSGLLGALVLSMTSGCALFLIGAGGAGGYLIRKGEDSGGSTDSNKSTPGGQNKPASKSTAEPQNGSSSD